MLRATLRAILPAIALLLPTIATAAAYPEPTAFEGSVTEGGGAQPSGPQPRGYISRQCGFDMNRDGVFGGAGDCNVCDGVTADPDGDGVSEDQIYVDCDTGTNNGSCGGPGNPCRTITYAWGTRADGPGDGAEDIICFRGTCREEMITPGVSGLPGTYTVPASGSQARDWQYPADPTMLVGWDSDNDGRYPPRDANDTAILEGSGGLTRAFFISLGNSRLEMGHFTVKDYGRFTTSSNSGWLDFGSSAGNIDHLYFHDLDLLNINRDRSSDSEVSAISFFSGVSRLHWLAFQNLNFTNTGSWFVRGAGQVTPPDDGPFRWQNISLTAHGCDVGTCGSGAGTPGFKVWSYMSGFEVLDSMWDANVAAWQPTTVGGPSGARFITVAQCIQDWVIRNNEVRDYKNTLDVQGYAETFCDGLGIARPVDQVVFDGNIVRNTYAPWLFGDYGIRIKDGGAVAGESVGSVTISNNFFSSTVGWESAIWSFPGHQTLPLSGTIVIANNTFYGDINRHGAVVIGNVEGSDQPFVQQHYIIKNNLFAGLGTNDHNVVTTYAPTLWDADFNVFDDNGVFTWQGNEIASLATWKATTGGDASTTTCTPKLVAGAIGNFHLSATDTCAKDAATELGQVTDRDVDNEARGEDGAWDIGADETGTLLFFDGFASGNTNGWSAAVP